MSLYRLNAIFCQVRHNDLTKVDSWFIEINQDSSSRKGEPRSLTTTLLRQLHWHIYISWMQLAKLIHRRNRIYSQDRRNMIRKKKLFFYFYSWSFDYGPKLLLDRYCYRLSEILQTRAYRFLISSGRITCIYERCSWGRFSPWLENSISE